ncbi:MAG: crossover junction endodeoxyribonuclease RuvC [Bacteroidales bacterium]|nr:crossover junction endodeoxyribonuclease RuvC [Bacteroidales bacterium]
MEKIILGIDPGTNIMGYSVIRTTKSKIELVVMDVLKLDKLSNQSLKLNKIFETTLRIIDSYHPDFLAIEAPFVGKNIQSALKLGRAQGVSMAAAFYRSVPVTEYLPRKIKQSITGSGSASKEQIAAMVARMVQIPEPTKCFDATDALAVAICHYLQKDIIDTGEKYSGWGRFLVENPGRVVKS